MAVSWTSGLDRSAMDVPRPRRRSARARALLVFLIGVAAVGVASAFDAIATRQRVVERSALLTGVVERSPFIVRVNASGVLVPEAIRWLTAESSGRVEAVFLQPGAEVTPETEVVRIENLDLRLLAVQAARELWAAEAEIVAHDRRSQEEALALVAERAEINALLQDTRRRIAVHEVEPGLLSPRLELDGLGDRADALAERATAAERRLTLLQALAPRQRRALEQQATELSEARRVRQELVERLVVRATVDGVLQDVLVELGEWVVPGTPLAKVMVNQRLKAELRVPAEHAARLGVGQVARVRTRFGEAQGASATGVVRRVAPAAHAGTVEVEVGFEPGALPVGARPDQNVDGSIEIERVDDALHVARPLVLAAGARVELFRLDPQARIATRVAVRLGRISLDRVEVLSGLEPGDVIVLSDMSRHVHEVVLRLD